MAYEFDASEIRFLQRIVRDRPAETEASDVAHFFCKQFKVGTKIGARIVYQPEHFDAAENMLRARGLPTEPVPAGASRSEVSRYGGLSEKTFSAPPHAQSVAIKTIGPCKLDGNPLLTPACAYLVVYPEEAMRVECDRLLFVENFETFRRLEKYAWLKPHTREWTFLVLFRGDGIWSPKEAATVLKTRKEPVWAFVDFDPAGLAIADRLPRLEHIVLPDDGWLESAANNNRGRQLFADQAPVCGPQLDESAHPEIASRWRQLKRLRSAVVQENMEHCPPR